MKGKHNAWKAWWVGAAAIAGCCIFPGCRQASTPAAAANLRAAMPPRAEDPATRELRAIGDRVIVAMMAKDISTLLEYDSDPEDQASLKSKSGELYCYLFDSTCISGARRQAVNELFAAAPHLGIDATVANVQGRNYGLLMFYDKSQISQSELYSPDLLCSDKGLRSTATWRFILANGKWTTSTLFEYKTERGCKATTQQAG